MATRVEAIAGWAAGLDFDDIPESVVALCRAQRKSVAAAIAASVNDAAARRVLSAVESYAPDGPAPLLGTDRRVTPEDAVFGAAALSIALDFDDYICFGHTGHSAVLVPLMLSAETAGSGRSQIVAQAIANEVGGRLGGACLIGPQNGQLWSFIHAAEAALAAAKMFGLDTARTAHALAISLYQAPRATIPGFMAPDSKLLTASEPSVSGMRAARLAAAGVTGPLDVLDHPDGFLSAFADAPIPGMLGGLGDGWATLTLSVKVYPGCAYLDTTIDALGELGHFEPETIETISVEAGMLTYGMNSMSSEYAEANGDAPTPVTVNFSIPWNVAAMILAGTLSPREVNEGWLSGHRDELAALVDKVRFTHDWELTRSSISSFNRLVPMDALIAEAGIGSLRKTLSIARSRQRIPSIPRMDPLGALRDIRGITSVIDLRALAMGGPSLMLNLARQGLEGLSGGAIASHPAGTATAQKFWEPEWLDKFAMKFPARVRVKVSGRKDDVALVSIPRGGCGHPTYGPVAAARDKLESWGPSLWGESRTATIAAAIDADDPQLVALIARDATHGDDAGAGVADIQSNGSAHSAPRDNPERSPL